MFQPLINHGKEFVNSAKSTEKLRKVFSGGVTTRSFALRMASFRSLVEWLSGEFKWQVTLAKSR